MQSLLNRALAPGRICWYLQMLIWEKQSPAVVSTSEFFISQGRHLHCSWDWGSCLLCYSWVSGSWPSYENSLSFRIFICQMGAKCLLNRDMVSLREWLEYGLHFHLVNCHQMTVIAQVFFGPSEVRFLFFFQPQSLMDTNYMKTWCWYLRMWTSRWHLLLRSSRSCWEEDEKGLWALARVRVNQVQISLDGTFSFKRVYGTQTSVYKEKRILGEMKLFYSHVRSIRQECLWLQATEQPINKEINK